jgi:hypothetical protein
MKHCGLLPSLKAPALGWALAALLLLPARLGFAQSVDLTGFWRNANARGDQYFPYRIRQIGNQVWWFADDLPRVANVFRGVIEGNILTGEWADLPGGELFNGGQLRLAIESNDRIVKIGESIPYGASVWVRQTIRTRKSVYAAFEPVVVDFLGFPGNPKDWITVVKASDGPEVEKQYYYTEGKREGTFTYDGLPPGDYEARAYFNWPDGGRIVRLRQPFRVEAMNTGVVLRTQKPVYYPNEPIVVEYIGFPGKNDWITVVKAGTPADQYAQYFYTGGKPGGFFTFTGLPAGDYEARAYFNWPDGGLNIQARYPFQVGSSGGIGAGGICADPRTLGLMDEWLAAAIPPQKEGESLRYEAWGRLVGRSLTALITVNGPPDTPLSRCEYLWLHAAELTSTNGLGTLKEYVEKRRP